MRAHLSYKMLELGPVRIEPVDVRVKGELAERLPRRLENRGLD